MAQSHNQYQKQRGTNLPAAGNMFLNVNGDAVMAWGAAIPDNVAGYAQGGLFFSNTNVFVNIGTTTNCLFSQVTNLGQVNINLAAADLLAFQGVLKDVDGDYIMGVGEDLPVNNGWAIGCMFMKSGANAGLYVNKGDTTTADFKAVTTAA